MEEQHECNTPMVHNLHHGGVFLKSYSIFENGSIVGTAEVITEGLYLNIRALCSPLSEQIYKLILSCNNKRISLGTCVPQEGAYIVNKRIQSKSVGDGELVFSIEAKNRLEHMQFVPINSDKPFSQLNHLPSAHYEKRNGICGVVLSCK